MVKALWFKLLGRVLCFMGEHAPKYSLYCHYDAYTCRRCGKYVEELQINKS
jgi:hypothetical protein